MVFQLIGIRIEVRKRSGPQPSMRAASASEAGMLRKCCLNRKVPVALARNGTVMAA